MTRDENNPFIRFMWVLTAFCVLSVIVIASIGTRESQRANTAEKQRDAVIEACKVKVNP